MTQTNSADNYSVFDCFKIGGRVFKPVNRFMDDAKNGRWAQVLNADGQKEIAARWCDVNQHWITPDGNLIEESSAVWYWK